MLTREEFVDESQRLTAMHRRGEIDFDEFIRRSMELTQRFEMLRPAVGANPLEPPAPGPWSVMWTTDGRPMVATAVEGLPLASTFRDPHRWELSNAYLMAAAPEMRDALRTVENELAWRFEQDVAVVEPWARDALDLVRAALRRTEVPPEEVAEEMLFAPEANPSNPHTPGPWVWTYEDNTIRDDAGRAVALMPTEGRMRLLRLGGEPIVGSNRMANARLIAAAPALLDYSMDAAAWLREHAEYMDPAVTEGYWGTIGGLEAGVLESGHEPRVVVSPRPAANPHTPGPWRVHESIRHGRVLVGDEDGVMKIVLRDGCVPVNDADARLIGAAPEMLDALGDVYHQLRTDADLDERVTNPRIYDILEERVRGAIASAAPEDAPVYIPPAANPAIVRVDPGRLSKDEEKAYWDLMAEDADLERAAVALVMGTRDLAAASPHLREVAASVRLLIFASPGLLDAATDAALWLRRRYQFVPEAWEIIQRLEDAIRESGHEPLMPEEELANPPGIWTPWGEADHTTRITPGLMWVGTPSHGGLALADRFAKAHLSPAALARGIPLGGRWFFEEDVAWTIAAWELAEWRPEIFRESTEYATPEAQERYLFETLSAWYPDYLLEVGVEPEPGRYARWQERREEERLRAARDPDIVTAGQLTDFPGVVYVWTADYRRHLVTEASYDDRERHRMRLSRMEVLARDIPERHPDEVSAERYPGLARAAVPANPVRTTEEPPYFKPVWEQERARTYARRRFAPWVAAFDDTRLAAREKSPGVYIWEMRTAGRLRDHGPAVSIADAKRRAEFATGLWYQDDPVMRHGKPEASVNAPSHLMDVFRENPRRRRRLPFIRAKVERDPGTLRVDYRDKSGRPVGWATLYLPDWIEDIEVDEEFRGRGYGTAILQDIVARGGRRLVTTSEEGRRLMSAQGPAWHAEPLDPEETGVEGDIEWSLSKRVLSDGVISAPRR